MENKNLLRVEYSRLDRSLTFLILDKLWCIEIGSSCSNNLVLFAVWKRTYCRSRRPSRTRRARFCRRRRAGLPAWPSRRRTARWLARWPWRPVSARCAPTSRGPPPTGAPSWHTRSRATSASTRGCSRTPRLCGCCACAPVATATPTDSMYTTSSTKLFRYRAVPSS